MTYFTTYARRSRIRTNNLNVLDIALVKHKEEKNRNDCGWRRESVRRKGRIAGHRMRVPACINRQLFYHSTVFHSLNCSDSSLHTYLTALINVLHGQYQWGVNFSCSFFIFGWHTSMQNLNKEEQTCDNVFVAFLW